MKDSNWVNLTNKDNNLDIVSEIFGTTQDDLIQPALELNQEQLSKESVSEFSRFKFLYNGLNYYVVKVRDEESKSKKHLEIFLEETSRVGINSIEREQIIQKAKMESNTTTTKVVLMVDDEQKIKEFIRIRSLESILEKNPNYEQGKTESWEMRLSRDRLKRSEEHYTIFTDNENKIFTLAFAGVDKNDKRVYHDTLDDAEKALMEKVFYTEWSMRNEIASKKENDFSQDYYIIQTLEELANKNRWGEPDKKVYSWQTT